MCRGDVGAVKAATDAGAAAARRVGELMVTSSRARTPRLSGSSPRARKGQTFFLCVLCVLVFDKR
jgi:hypothetical protein